MASVRIQFVPCRQPWFWVLVLATFLGWLALLGGGDSGGMASICSATSSWWIQGRVGGVGHLAILPFHTIAFAWFGMIIAMMMPLLFEPIRALRWRTFTSLRNSLSVLFGAGYILVWMLIGPLLLTLSAAISLLGEIGVGVALGAALIWQLSPVKQWSLNRCHRQPIPPASGGGAFWGSFKLGVSHGLYCVVACWALMLISLVSPKWHMPIMIGTALFVFAERLQPSASPEWGWHGIGRAMRIAKLLIVNKIFLYRISCATRPGSIVHLP